VLRNELSVVTFDYNSSQRAYYVTIHAAPLCIRTAYALQEKYVSEENSCWIMPGAVEKPPCFTGGFTPFEDTFVSLKKVSGVS